MTKTEGIACEVIESATRPQLAEQRYIVWVCQGETAPYGVRDNQTSEFIAYCQTRDEARQIANDANRHVAECKQISQSDESPSTVSHNLVTDLTALADQWDHVAARMRDNATTHELEGRPEHAGVLRIQEAERRQCAAVVRELIGRLA